MKYLIIALIVLVIALLVWICACNSREDKLEYANEKDPYIKPEIMENFLTPEECDAIIKHSKDKLLDSEVVSGKDHKIRNSKQVWIEKENLLVKKIYDKLSAKFNIPIENAENLQVVNYKPNQYYNEHHDACCDNNNSCRDFVKRGGQRILTILIYLNNEFTDGETYFKNLNLKIKPPKGSAIIFRPLAEGTNKCHPLALHAGLPITTGEKWICNVWFRERKFV
jgi:prolyl 4-hydroxylase